METKTAKDLYRNCVLCKKSSLVDLLDQDGVCEYCKELRRVEGTKTLRFLKAVQKKKCK